MHFSLRTRRNIMGGTNVIIDRDGVRYGVRSYATAWNAKRAILSGAALRVTVGLEG